MSDKATRFSILLGFACISCIGEITDRSSGGDLPPRPGGAAPSADESSPFRPSGSNVPSPDTALRRLTRTEYNNTVRDLLGDTSQPASALNPEATVNGFDNNSNQVNKTFDVDKYDALAANIVENAFRAGSSSRSKLLTCDPTVGGK